jgi:hypothetical protein
MFLLINGVFIKHFPTVCWMISLTVILVATPIRIRYAAIGLIRSGFRHLLAPLIMICGENKSAVNFRVVGVNETTPPPEVLFNFFDFAAIFLATDGSTRRMARDGRPLFALKSLQSGESGGDDWRRRRGGVSLGRSPEVVALAGIGRG